MYLTLRGSRHSAEHTARKEAQLLQALVSFDLQIILLARLVISVPLLSSTAQEALIPQPALLVDANPGLAKGTGLCLGALGFRCRLPGDVTSSSIRLPPLFGFDPFPPQGFPAASRSSSSISEITSIHPDEIRLSFTQLCGVNKAPLQLPGSVRCAPHSFGVCSPSSSGARHGFIAMPP